ncbi:MAG: diacylglycerol kinase [Pseudomonadota bacterium]
MSNQPLKGIARLRAAYVNSMQGARDIWRGEEAFRLEVVLLAVSIPFAVWLGDDLFQTANLIGVILVLLIVEILNSAIEAAVDRIGPERHELSRVAKDLGSLAVLVATVLVGLVWLAALADRLWA